MEFERLSRRLRAGQAAYGYIVTSPSRHVTRTLARTGIDFVIIDMEHPPMGVESVHDMIAATTGTLCTPLVRIPAPQAQYTKPVLDSGAAGIVIPQVESAEQVAAAVALTKYPPAGARGVGAAFALDRWQLAFSEYVRIANANILVLAIIETVGGIEHLDEILRCPGLDGCIIARSDLSASLGHIGDICHPDVVRCVEETEGRIRKAGVVLCGVAMTPPEAVRMHARGYRFISLGTDLGALESVAKTTLARARDITNADGDKSG